MNLKGQKVWISDDLTPQRESMAYLCRQDVSQKKVTQTWTYDGKVYIYQDQDGGQAISYQQPRRDPIDTVVFFVNGLDYFLHLDIVTLFWNHNTQPHTCIYKET